MLARAVRRSPRRAATAHIRTLKLLRMPAGEADRIARHDTVCSDLKAHLRSRDILRAVIDLRDLFERTRKIPRRNRSRRRKVHAILCVDRCRAVREVVILPRVARDLYIICDTLRRNIAAAARNILVRIAALHRHLCAVIHGIAVLRAHELVGVGRARSISDIRSAVDIRKGLMVTVCRVDEVGIAVIDLVDAARLCKTDIDRAARDPARTRRRRVSALKVLPVQRIVFEQVLVAAIRRRLDIVRDALGLIDIRRPRRIVCLCEMSTPIGIDGKADLIRVCCNHACAVPRARAQVPAGRNRVVAGAVIDLRRMGGVPMCIDNVEVVRVNRLAVDRPLAIDGLVHRIVARCRRAEGILERLVHLRIANVMRRAVARICIGAEGTARTVAVAARCRTARALTLPRSLQRTSCDTVPTENRSNDRGLRRIRDLRNTAVRIGRRAVIGLGHIAHLDVQLARRNLARVCHRAGIRRECPICTSARKRTDARISCVDNLIVVHILPCELGRIGDILVDDIAAAVTRDILIRIACRRGVRRQSVRLIRNHRRKADDIAPAFDIAAAVRMLSHTVIDLLDGVRCRADRARGNPPLCGHMRGVRIRHSLEVAERPRRLLCRRAKGIVRQRMIRRIARACYNVIGDMLRLRDVGGTVVAVGIAGEMPRRA